MKLKYAYNGICLVAVFGFSSLAQAQTLQEAIQLTIYKNPQIQSAKSERLAVEHEIDQAKAGYFPTIDVAAGIGWEQSNNPGTRGRRNSDVHRGREETSILLRQMVFDGFSTSSEVRRHRARTNARAHTVYGQSEIIGLNAVEAYINVLRRQELLALAKENLVIHRKTNDQINLRSKSGVGRAADAEQSYGRLALAERNTLSETGNLQDAETAFLRVVGELPKDLTAVPSPSKPSDDFPETLDQALEQALDNHPTLKSANSDVDSAFAQHSTAKAAYMPRLDVEAGATHNDDLDGTEGVNEDAFVMLRLRYNILNGGRDLARRKETAELINQAKNIRDNTYRQVIESMRLSWVAHQTIKHQLIFFKEHMDASTKSNEAYQKQFNFGQRTLLDLLDSANEMFVAKSAYTEAKYDLLFSEYRILTSKGELNKYLGTELPEEVKTIADEIEMLEAKEKARYSENNS